jgi:hypothetical protein
MTCSGFYEFGLGPVGERGESCHLEIQGEDKDISRYENRTVELEFVENECGEISAQGTLNPRFQRSWVNCVNNLPDSIIRPCHIVHLDARFASQEIDG